MYIFYPRLMRCHYLVPLLQKCREAHVKELDSSSIMHRFRCQFEYFKQFSGTLERESIKYRMVSMPVHHRKLSLLTYLMRTLFEQHRLYLITTHTQQQHLLSHQSKQLEEMRTYSFVQLRIGIRRIMVQRLEKCFSFQVCVK